MNRIKKFFMSEKKDELDVYLVALVFGLVIGAFAGFKFGNGFKPIQATQLLNDNGETVGILTSLMNGGSLIFDVPVSK